MKLSYSDIYPGLTLTSEGYPVKQEEVIAFASQWDPQPFHIDPVAARSSLFGKLAACGMHTQCIRGILQHRMPQQLDINAGLGAESVTLPKPVYPGDVLTLTVRVVDMRASASQPQRGIVRVEQIMRNQNREVVLQQVAVVMMPIPTPSELEEIDHA
ncbi:dehydratase [Pseudomaricurvus alkylphenolicus]|uniref:MaoC/PaaZ C-terminal domain-containing protein n=1 Tax=Pseudomaricurvus alkylphenolicus TaxID=1306991 RepID=UPI00142305C7|nr:MaoC/PaaZ C-terminal domain-containing protein [Pseudomaricurvus alkylphenolicus]NIB38338.1 dehydratase [Pseudomaricurvus alkylphenolicus]